MYSCTGVYGMKIAKAPMKWTPDSAKAQVFPEPSTSFMYYLVAGARFELATFGL